MAKQIGYFIAWILAGGQLIFDEKEKEKLIGIIPPIRPVHFDTNENIIFSPNDLQKTAEELFKKYGKGQVIIYDEARGGLASDRAMESINKTMSEWFEQCGQYGHVIILVLPNFFKLHEDYAVARSLFLIDVYTDKFHNRGYFNFYNEIQKEKLYYFGKRRIGVTAKYAATDESFWGRFTKFTPCNERIYDKRKKEAIKNLKRTRYEKKFIKRYQGCVYLLKKLTELSFKAMAKELTIICGDLITESMVEAAYFSITQGQEAQ